GSTAPLRFLRLVTLEWVLDCRRLRPAETGGIVATTEQSASTTRPTLRARRRAVRLRTSVVGAVGAVLLLVLAPSPAGATTFSWTTTAAMTITGPGTQTVEHLAYAS